ncbi:MAG TPA: response regulator [Polyangiaceae bacterium]|nr:response regulator [Polyangiaceae bacterium]
MTVRVLVVDDEEAIRRNFRALLEDAGYAVSEGSNGIEGLAAFSRAQPDIVLTDLRMQFGNDGLDLVAAIHDRADEVPVIVVSGSGTLKDAVAAIRLGAWDYLIKPVQLSEELLVAVQRNLERARLLRENRLYRTRLEEMVADRTAALVTAQQANQTLQARLMRAQTLECLGLLAGGIAHDFNNLITVIRAGFDELESSPHSRREEVFPMIDVALTQAANLTQQIFGFAGRAPSKRVLCNVSQVVASIEKLLRSAIKSGVTLRTELGAVPSILADPVQVQQIALNLALNAAEAMNGHGVVKIVTSVCELPQDLDQFVSLTGSVRPGQYVFVRVEDSGSGMDETTLRKLGNPFFTTKANGHGLGLTTVIGIVRGLGGTLAVQSALGSGTRFLAALPIVASAEEMAPPPSFRSRG